MYYVYVCVGLVDIGLQSEHAKSHVSAASSSTSSQAGVLLACQQGVELEFLGLRLMVLSMVSLQIFQIWCRLSSVWIEQDQAIFLHPDEIIRFLWSSTDYATVELT